jgi:hypothetical protein
MQLITDSRTEESSYNRGHNLSAYLKLFLFGLHSTLKIFGLAGRVAQVVEYLPSKCEALSSDPSTAPSKKTQNKNKNEKPFRPKFKI